MYGPLPGSSSIDGRRPLGGTELPRREAGSHEQLLNEVGGLGERPILGGHARLSAEQVGDPERVVGDVPELVGHRPMLRLADSGAVLEGADVRVGVARPPGEVERGA